MHKSIVSIVVFIIIVSSDFLFAQCNLKISGRCFDILHKNESLEYIIFINEDNLFVKTDTKGNFNISQLCAGKKSMIVQSNSGHQLRFVIILTKDTLMEIDMHDESKFLEEIVILDHVQTKLQSTSQTILDSKTLFLNSGGGFSDLMQNVAGVSFIKTGNTISKPVIRGLHSNRILMLNNGIRQEGQNWGSEHAPEIDAYLASQITVVKGPASVRYGNEALAGVVIMDVADLPDSTGIAGEINSSLNTNGRGGALSAIVQQKIKNSGLAYRIQGTVRRFGDIHAPDYVLSNTAFSERNFSVNLGYKTKHLHFNFFTSRFNTNLGIFRASHIGNLTDLQLALKSKIPLDTSSFSYSIRRPNQEVSHALYKMTINYLSNNLGKISLVYALQDNNRSEFDRSPPRNDSIAALNRPELNFNLITHTVDAIWEHNHFRGLSGSIGVNFMHQYNIYSGRNLIPNFFSNSAGIFFIEHLLIKKTELEFAFRYDVKTLNAFERNRNNEIIASEFLFNKPTLSLGLIHPFSDNLKFNLNLSTGWRAPSVYELFIDGIHQAKANYVLGNRNLLPETIKSLTGDLNWRPFAFSVFSIGIFAQQIDNFIYQLPSSLPVLTIQGAFPSFYVTQRNVFMHGMDFNADFNLNEKLSFRFAASMVRAKTQNNEWVYGIPSDRLNSKLNFNPFSGSWKAFTISASHQIVFKQIRIPPNIDFAPPPNAYNLFNVELFHRFNNLTLLFGVNNLLNKRYRDFLNAFRYFADEQGRNFFIKLKYLI